MAERDEDMDMMDDATMQPDPPLPPSADRDMIVAEEEVDEEDVKSRAGLLPATTNAV